MKIWLCLGIVACSGVLAVSAAAQKPKRPVPRTAPTPVRQVVTADERAAKQTASNQLANLSGYLQKFTPMVQPLNDLATADKAGKLSKKASTDYNNAKKKLRLDHQTVNHSKHFKDLDSGVHTNTIEGNWNGIKITISPRSRTADHIDDHLHEFIWRRQNSEDLWGAFIQCLVDSEFF